MPRFGPHIPIFDVKARRGQIRTGTALGTAITRMYLSALTLPVEIPTPVVATSVPAICMFIIGRTITSNVGQLEGARGIAIQGDYAYIATQASGASTSDRLTIMDISDPTSMSVVGSHGSVHLDGPNNVAYRDGFAYVMNLDISDYGRLVVFDVSDPTTPTLVAKQWPTPVESSHMSIVDDVIYMTGGSRVRTTRIS